MTGASHKASEDPLGSDGGGLGRVLAILIGVIAVVGAQGMMASPLLPDIAASFSVGPAAVGLAIGVYGLMTALSALVAAKRLDTLPRRRALLGGFLLLLVGLAKSALAPTLAFMLLGQAVAGTAAGIILPTAYAYAGDVAPPERRATIVGRALFGWSLALVVAIPAGGFLGGLLGWRGVFAILAGLSGVCVAAVWMLPRVPRLPAPPPSYRATLKLPGAAIGLLASLCNMTGFFGMYAYLGAAIRTGTDLGSSASAVIVLCYGLGFTLGLPLGATIDRIGPKRAMTLSMAALAVLLLLLGQSVSALWQAGLVIGILGVAQNVALNSIVSVMGNLSDERRGSLMALNTVVTYVGVMLGGAAMGPVFEAVGFDAVTLCSAVLLVLGTVLSRFL